MEYFMVERLMQSVPLRRAKRTLKDKPFPFELRNYPQGQACYEHCEDVAKVWQGGI
jgi:hypothetical protein